MKGLFAIPIVLLVPWQALAGKAWQLDGEVSVSATYDSNVFGLGDAEQDRVDAEAAVDEATGRIGDMKSVDDFLSTVTAGLKLSLPDAGFSILPRLAYHRYALNGEKSYPELAIELREEVGGESAVLLDFGYALDRFEKSYLAGSAIGTDVVVLPSQRIYDTAVYDEMSFGAAFDHTLLRRPRSTLRQLDARLGAGYRMQEFDRPFANHDLDSWDAGLELRAQLGESFHLELSYAYADFSAPSRDEVAIVDEADVGLDLNFDVDTTDSDVATLAEVDRSRIEHAPGVALRLDLPSHADLWLGYRYTRIEYAGGDELDVAHLGREDAEHAFRAGIHWGFAKHWRATFAAEHAWRVSNTAASLIGEEQAPHSGSVAHVVLTWEY